MRRQQIVASAVVFSWLFSGCGSVAVPYIKGDQDGKKEWTGDETSKEYCSRLTTNADATAQKELGWGIVLGILSGGMAVTGAAVGPDTGSDASWLGKGRSGLIIAGGALLALPATLLLTRSKDANAASANAGQAMGLSDNAEMMKQCLAARTALVNARSNIADAAQKDITARVKQYQDVIDKATEARKDAETKGDVPSQLSANALIKAAQAKMAAELNNSADKK